MPRRKTPQPHDRRGRNPLGPRLAQRTGHLNIADAPSAVHWQNGPSRLPPHGNGRARDRRPAPIRNRAPTMETPCPTRPARR